MHQGDAGGGFATLLAGSGNKDFFAHGVAFRA
jgi:hypothetical protein